MDEKLLTRLYQQCELRGLGLTANQGTMLMRYLDLVVEGRQHLNLTGLHTAERMLDVLLLESLDFLHSDLLLGVLRTLDLGTGAGVPGISLAIGAPDLHMTLLDRSEKKIAFLRRVVRQLALTNCYPHCNTSEALGRDCDPTQRFERIVSRGVGSIAHLLRLAAPLLVPGGKLILRKPVATAEVQEIGAVLNNTIWQGVQIKQLPGIEPKPWCLLAFTKIGS